MRQDADWLLDAAIDLGVLGGAMDRNQFWRGLADIIADYAALPLKDWSLAEAFLRVTRLGQAQNVFVPYELLILMRTMFLAENTVAVLDPDFQLLENLQAKGAEMLKAALEQSDWSGSLDRLKHDAASAMQDLPGHRAISCRCQSGPRRPAAGATSASPIPAGSPIAIGRHACAEAEKSASARDQPSAEEACNL
jgi:predicted unusual protein kinase regulating ubiquinone biosynthesis (AarF/ABC1/UbiB family)